MTKKNKIFGIIGTVCQLAAVAAGFFPFIYRIEEYIYDPAAGEFIFDRTAKKYSLFFDPTALDITEAAADPPAAGFAFLLSALFVLAGITASVFAILSLIKNKKSSLPAAAGIAGLAFLLLSAVCVLKFDYQIYTWYYAGFLSAGILIVFVLQLFAAAAFLLARKK